MKRYVNLKLEEYYNHKAILTKDANEDTLLDNVGLPETFRGFLDSSCPQSNEILVFNSAPIVFPDKSPSKYDNIECDGTIIDVPAGKYSQIHIFGFSTWQNSSDFIKLMFADQSSGKISFSFLDWYNCINGEYYEMKFDRDILIQNYEKAYIGENTLGGEGGFTYSYSPIQERDSELVGLEMPFNPNIHILAITLEK